MESILITNASDSNAHLTETALVAAVLASRALLKKWLAIRKRTGCIFALAFPAKRAIADM
jgi:hypothetical protein